jgi:hypothetical protein
MPAQQNKLICLTPVKNEAWILDQFLACASLWADHIILADQLSDDETREIARKYSKVILVDNQSPTFNEPERQQLLLREGRKIEGPKVFITLDADEFLTADLKSSPEWEQILQAPPGTVFRFDLVNVLPGFQRGWVQGNNPFAIADDGSAHKGKTIHSPRIPLPENGPTITLSEIKVLHYQYTDWERMQSKHCWYQCYECLHFPEKKMVELYRKYHHMDPYLKRQRLTIPLEPKWLAAYEQTGISMREVRRTDYWWDPAVVQLLIEHGTRKFSNAAIWHRDWNALRPSGITANLRDPRSLAQKCIHAYLDLTQPYSKSGLVKKTDLLVQALGF